MSDKKKKPKKRASGAKRDKKPARRTFPSAPLESFARPLVVGIGASAGGLDAFRTFFAHVPADTGMAFVLVQHLAPDHPSMLTELIRRQTSMTVVEGSDQLQVVENCVFVIPPNATLTIKDRVLRVSKPAPPREVRRPIDTFFAALAEDQKECAVCIVLSGTGTDGTLGVRAIKEHGGLTLAQSDTGSEVLSGMPHSAAATGLVDHLMPVADMGALLVDYQNHLRRVSSKKDDNGNRRDMPAHLSAICASVRAATGHDFSQYKAATLMRRIQRRMQVLRIDSVSAFIERLRKEPRQVDLLFQEFLIGVTQFFRDPRAYEVLQKTALPALLKEKGPDDAVRIWVPGCATGEEVYSLAIALREEMLRLGIALRVQIFGTDIDEAAIASARAGRYHKKLEGVSAERIKRWFTAEGGEYCLLREIREMCIFSIHNVIKDPPFSRMDLISCRNLFIYFEAELQDRMLQTFHYALRQGAHLWLGQSEGVARSSKLFESIDDKHRIFRRRTFSGATPGFALAEVAKASKGPVVAPQSPMRASDLVDIEVRGIMAKHSPAYLVIDSHEDIVRFSGGRVARYLEPAASAASLNLMSIVLKDLRPAIHTAMQRARKTNGAITTEHTRVRIDGRHCRVNLIVEPLDNSDASGRARWVVAFQEAGSARRQGKAKTPKRSANAELGALESELYETRIRLSAAIQELASISEEAKSAGEEFQSVNEELQSSNEELETAKEEMQSVNEELQTINAEMHAKNATLTRLNSDLKNLLDSTHIATLFLDHELRVRSFTPGITEIFRLRDMDMGRPITEIAGGVAQGQLRSDIAEVLQTLSVIEREIRLSDRDSVFVMHVRPYLSVDGILEGAVLTFVDITERKRDEEAWGRLAAIVESSQDAIIGHALDGIITSWNAGAVAIFGYTREEALGKPFAILVPESFQVHVPRLLESLQRGERVNHFEVDRVGKDGRKIDVSLTISPVLDARGRTIAASTVAREITERKLAQEHQNVLMAELDHRVKNTLMVITSLISQTLRSTDSPGAFAHIIEGRIQALGRAHDLLNQSNCDRASLREVIAGELEPYRAGAGSILIEGEVDVVLTPQATQTLSLALHELATNAAKYGALSSAAGRVTVRWDVKDSPQGLRLSLDWTESGGPRVDKPTRRGFGSDLIERVVRGELQADVERTFDVEGVRCRIEAALTHAVGTVE